MLRRSFVPSLSAATVATPFFCFSAAVATSAARGIFAFTEQSPIFANNAKHLKYKSNVWLEADKDEYWYSKKTELKSADEKPTEVSIDRLFIYFNGDCLADRGDQKVVEDISAKNGSKKELGNAANNQQLSYSSGKPLSPQVAKKLSEVATGRQYNSNVWIPSSQIRAKNIKLLPFARATHVIIPVPGKFLNADQFKDPAAITRAPVSAYKRVPFGGETAEKLAQDVKKNNYATGLYFTAGQLELFHLIDKLKPSAIPIKIEMDNNHFGDSTKEIQTALYNIMDVEGGQELLKELNRFPVTEHTYAISGKAVTQKDILAAVTKSPASVKSKYWVSAFDLQQRSKTVVAGAQSVDVTYQIGGSNANNTAKPAKPNNVVAFFSVYDLQDPTEGFKIAGTRATNFIPDKQ